MLARSTTARETSHPLASPGRFSIQAIVLLAVFGALNLGDLASTWLDLNAGMREGNPLMSQLLASHGFGALIIYKVLVITIVGTVAAGLWTARPRLITITLVACNLLILAAVVSNVLQYTV